MKTGFNSGILFFLLLVAQMVITNYFHLSQFIVLSILPALIICLPLSLSTSATMLICFATGLGVDLLADGVFGINTVALLPVAFTRKFFLARVFGEDLVERGSEFSFRKNGPAKTFTAIVIAVALFFTVFIIADGAGTRPFWFNAVRFILSVVTSSILSAVAVNVLNSEDRR